jgi:hypothetical protein
MEQLGKGFEQMGSSIHNLQYGLFASGTATLAVGGGGSVGMMVANTADQGLNLYMTFGEAVGWTPNAKLDGSMLFGKMLDMKGDGINHSDIIGNGMELSVSVDGVGLTLGANVSTRERRDGTTQTRIGNEYVSIGIGAASSAAGAAVLATQTFKVNGFYGTYPFLIPRLSKN